MSIKPSFQGEVQFVRYSDTSRGGQTVLLRVPGRDELEPFIGKEGRRYMAVLVEIGDDEQPINGAAQVPQSESSRDASLDAATDPAAAPPDASTTPGSRAPAKRSTGPICQWLVMRCKEPEFQEWLTVYGDFATPLDEKGCAQVVRDWCNVQSRAEIDGEAKAEALFKKFFQAPWLAHTKATARV